MHPRALWLNSRSRATAATFSFACIQGVPGGSSGAPALSARDIYELGLSPLSLSTIATLSGSHVIAGAAAAIGLALGYLLLLHMGMGGQ